jgi:hypothetical protein
MPIYQRTEEGQWAAYNPESALPRKLKSLLKVIDGKTSMAVYVETLSAFGDVQAVFASMFAARLIEPVTASEMVRVNAPQPAPVQEILLQPTPSYDWSQTVQPATLSTNVAQNSKLDTMQKLEAQSALAHAVGLMSDFILVHLPAQAMDVLRELEELQSIEQLAATFGGYEQIVGQAGPASQAHLVQIKKIIVDHF